MVMAAKTKRRRSPRNEERRAACRPPLFPIFLRRDGHIWAIAPFLAADAARNGAMDFLLSRAPRRERLRRGAEKSNGARISPRAAI
ncbi:hypothetical protein ACIPPQ_16865 [Sphingopyxis sp. LARHCG72]